MSHTTRKYAFLLDDPDTNRWYQALGCNSPGTAQNYLDSLGRFLERNHLEARGFLQLPARRRDDLMQDFIISLHGAQKSKSSMKGAKAGVASWLEHHGERFTRRFRYPIALVPTKASQFRIPDQVRTREVHDASNTRQRLIAALTGQAGLRPGILGNKKGTAGLQFWMLPETRLTPAGIVFDRIPTRINVPDYLNKVRHAFFTFLGPEGCQYPDCQRQRTPSPRRDPDAPESRGAAPAQRPLLPLPDFGQHQRPAPYPPEARGHQGLV